MSDITKLVGQRIRCYRTQVGASQEQLAEQAGCHWTYIGQIERGEKNITVDRLARLCAALDVPLSELFQGVEDHAHERAIPQAVYEWLLEKPLADQERIYRILMELDAYKNG